MVKSTGTEVQLNTNSLGNTKSATAYANYSFGPVTVGVQQSYTSGSVSATGTHEGGNEVENLGIAFNVNDALSVSYQDLSNTRLNTSGNADVETEMDGIQIAYTMGGATLRISDVSVLTVDSQRITVKTEQKLVC